MVERNDSENAKEKTTATAPNEHVPSNVTLVDAKEFDERRPLGHKKEHRSQKFMGHDQKERDEDEELKDKPRFDSNRGTLDAALRSLGLNSSVADSTRLKKDQLLLESQQVLVSIAQE